MNDKTAAEQAEEAFEASFNSDEYELEEDPKEEIKEEPAEEPKEEATGEQEDEPKEEPKAEEADEWAGVPEAIKAKFTAMEAEVKNAQHIANTANGQARKLQSEFAKQQKSADKPVPTSDQIQKAMADPQLLEALKEDWPDIAAVIGELKTSVSQSVGSSIDQLRDQLRQEFQGVAQNTTARVESQLSQAKLDTLYPGWQNDVQGNEFKEWLRQGGPTESEMSGYDQALSNASLTDDPGLKAQYQQAAEKYYTNLLTNYPVWAQNKGKLYADSTVEGADKMLKMFYEATKPEEKPKGSRLEDNVTPTLGKGSKAPSKASDDAETAFLKGFG